MHIRRARLTTAALAALLVALPASGHEVLERKKLGNLVRDLTSIATGALAGHIVLLDGFDVRAIPAGGAGLAADHERTRFLFDTRDLGLAVPPSGVAFVESERSLVLVALVGSERQLLLVDTQGRVRERRPIQFLGAVPLFNGALAYVPHDAPLYPDHLLLAIQRLPPGVPSASIAILRTDGVMVGEIDLHLPPVPAGLVFGVEFLRPDRILGSTLPDRFLTTLDFAGNVLNRTNFPSLGSLAQLKDGRVVLSSRDTLRYFDETLAPLAGERGIGIGPGLPLVHELAWNEATGDYAMLQAFTVHAVPPALDTSLLLLNLLGSGQLAEDVAVLPDENLVAVSLQTTTTAPGTIGLVTQGTVVETLPLDGITPSNLEYLARSQEFVVTEFATPRVHVLDRSGRTQRIHDLTALALRPHLAYFDPDHPSGGRWLVVAEGQGRIHLTDFAFTPIAEIDPQELGLARPTGVTAITSGPWTGGFAILEPQNAEVVVFCLDQHAVGVCAGRR